MPLIKGKSPKAFEHNIKAEMHAGKPQNQSLAIAYAMKRKAQKKAMGGVMESGYQDHEDANKKENYSADATQSKHEKFTENLDPHNLVDRILQKYNQGGNVDGDPTNEMHDHQTNEREMKKYAFGGNVDGSPLNKKYNDQKNEDLFTEDELDGMEGRYSHGGRVNDPYPEKNTVQRIESEIPDHSLKGMKGMYKKGGMVEGYAMGGYVSPEEREPGLDANSGMADETSGKKINDFDYLSVGDLDDSTTNSGEAAGDFLDNDTQNKLRSDIIMRIRRSLAKKDRMPNPA